MVKSNDSAKLLVEERATKEREKSDLLYAIKIVEKIVFAIVGAAGLAVLYALFRLVVLSQPIVSSTHVIPHP